jgi:hypothetical protein
MIIGAGGFGIVINSEYQDIKTVTKLLYNISDCQNLELEVKKQQIAYDLLNSQNFHDYLENFYFPSLNLLPPKVPKIYKHFNHKIKYHDKEYLCGIVMEKVNPIWFNSKTKQYEIVHLNFNIDDDTDTSVIVLTRNDLNNNVLNSRGFYASPQMIEAIIEDGDIKPTVSGQKDLNLINSGQKDLNLINSGQKDLNLINSGQKFINSIVVTMALTIRYLVLHGFYPNDVEWVIDDKGQVWIIDFGLCEIDGLDSNPNLLKYYNTPYPRGLKGDPYIPQESEKSNFSEIFKKFYFQI